MNNLINSDLVTALIAECDNIRRREASDIEDDGFEKKNIPYIDTNNYLSEVSNDNNTLIYDEVIAEAVHDYYLHEDNCSNYSKEIISIILERF